MLKKIIIFSLLFVNFAQAETCPTIADLKAHHLNQWQATDFGSAEPATPEKTSRFLNKADRLAVVSWDFSEYGRCFYANGTEQPDQLGVFLEKVTSPDQSRGNWHYSDPDSWICEGDVYNCEFISK